MYNAPITNQQPSFNNNPVPMQNQFIPFTPAPIANSSSAYLSGVPPIELAQQAMPSNQGLPPPPISSQRNPTPPSGWNDPPALKSRPPQVFLFCLIYCTCNYYIIQNRIIVDMCIIHG